MTYGQSLARLRPHLVLVGLAALSLVSACDNPVVPMQDGGQDAAFTLPDGSVSCTTAADCDDHIACTNDSCLAGVQICGHTVDHTRCDDGVFCNGSEVCDLVMGCTSVATHETCDDGNVCTLDRCIESTKMCEHLPRDLDEDGDPDFFCDGGMDCDDRDPTRSGIAPELCDDMIDNDCDGTVDEGSVDFDSGGADAGIALDDAGRPLCGRPPHDTCMDPVAITASGVTVLQVGGASADYTLGCVGIARPDLVASLTLTEPHDVTITAEGDLATATVAMRGTCGDVTTETDCNNGYPGVIRRRSVPAGTYYLIVQGSGEVILDVQLTDPTPAPTNETCAAPILIPPTGGHYTGNFVDVANDLMLGCNPGAAPDLVYQLDLPMESNVSVTLAAPDGQYMSWSIRPTCSASTGEVRCESGSPADGTIHQLPAGTYFIVIEGPSYVEVDYTLAVDVTASTPRVPGDLCTSAIPLTLGTPYTGTMSGSEDDIVTSCGFNYRDVVHSFTLAATSDVDVEIDGGLSYLNASIRTACDTASSQLRCVTGAPLSTHMRAAAPGTYYVIVEGARVGAYTMTVTATTPPTIPTPAVGNDNCGGATVIPTTGGYWTGTTATSVNDYDPLTCGTGNPANDVAFRLDLPVRSRVTATTLGSSFDTLLYRMAGTCRTRMEARCDDDGGGGGGSSQLSEMLDPGTYFYIVDGYTTTAVGNYEFQVFITPAP